MNGKYMRAAEIRWHKRQPARLEHIRKRKQAKTEADTVEAPEETDKQPSMEDRNKGT